MLRFFRRRTEAPADVAVAPASALPLAAPTQHAATASRVQPAWSLDDVVAAWETSDTVISANAARAELEAAAALERASSDQAALDRAANAVAWRERLRGNGLGRALAGLLSGNPKLDEDLLDELETALLSADVGIAATTLLLGNLRTRMAAREFIDADALYAALRADLLGMLRRVELPLVIDDSLRPFVLLVVGVNGVGKTTTIGKLARHMQNDGARLLLAAGDTFRAAAVEQLKAWGDRNSVPVISQGQGADAASVAFDALQAARSRDIDVLIIDTAGRLHNQSGLMDELAKVRRVLGKLEPTAPHEVLLVIDGTTGQNALSQL
ncbi:MAG: signal recognition particle receptor subunit alpha, partial [Lysobacterales bacterium]